METNPEFKTESWFDIQEADVIWETLAKCFRFFAHHSSARVSQNWAVVRREFGLQRYNDHPRDDEVMRRIPRERRQYIAYEQVIPVNTIGFPEGDIARIVFRAWFNFLNAYKIPTNGPIPDQIMWMMQNQLEVMWEQIRVLWTRLQREFEEELVVQDLVENPEEELPRSPTRLLQKRRSEPGQDMQSSRKIRPAEELVVEDLDVEESFRLRDSQRMDLDQFALNDSMVEERKEDVENNALRKAIAEEVGPNLVPIRKPRLTFSPNDPKIDWLVGFSSDHDNIRLPFIENVMKVLTDKRKRTPMVFSGPNAILPEDAEHANGPDYMFNPFIATFNNRWNVLTQGNLMEVKELYRRMNPQLQPTQVEAHMKKDFQRSGPGTIRQLMNELWYIDSRKGGRSTSIDPNTGLQTISRDFIPPILSTHPIRWWFDINISYANRNYDNLPAFYMWLTSFELIRTSEVHLGIHMRTPGDLNSFRSFNFVHRVQLEDEGYVFNLDRLDGVSPQARAQERRRAWDQVFHSLQGFCLSSAFLYEGDNSPGYNDNSVMWITNVKIVQDKRYVDPILVHAWAPLVDLKSLKKTARIGLHNGLCAFEALLWYAAIKGGHFKWTDINNKPAKKRKLIEECIGQKVMYENGGLEIFFSGKFLPIMDNFKRRAGVHYPIFWLHSDTGRWFADSEPIECAPNLQPNDPVIVYFGYHVVCASFDSLQQSVRKRDNGTFKMEPYWKQDQAKKMSRTGMLIFIDMETIDLGHGVQFPFLMCVWAYSNVDGVWTKQLQVEFQDLDIPTYEEHRRSSKLVIDFLSWLTELRVIPIQYKKFDKKKKADQETAVIGHNSMRFDFNFFFRDVSFLLSARSLGTVKNPMKMNVWGVDFLDLAKIFPQKLDTLGECFLKMKKMSLPFEWNTLTRENLLERLPIIREYCHRDVEILSGVWLKTQELIQSFSVTETRDQIANRIQKYVPTDEFNRSMDSCPTVVTRRMSSKRMTTASALSLQIFQTLYCSFEVPSPPEEIYQISRLSYLGGSTQVFNPKCNGVPMPEFPHNFPAFNPDEYVWHQKATCYDVNSFYPSCMRIRLPIRFKKTLYFSTSDVEYSSDLSNPHYGSHRTTAALLDDWTRNGDDALVLVSWKLKERKHYMTMGLKTQSGSIVYVADTKNKYSWKWAKEIRTAMKCYGNDISFKHKGVVLWETAPLFELFIHDLYARRMACDSVTEEALKKLLKDVMNSAYGKLGQKNFGETTLSTAFALISSWLGLGTDVKVDNYEGDIFLVTAKSSKRPDGTGNLVQIASRITAEARAELLEMIYRIWRENPHLSLYDIVSYIDTDSMFIRGNVLIPKDLVDKAKLGKLKLEYEFDEGDFYGAKSYYLKQFVNDPVKGEVVKKIIKMKGVKKEAVNNGIIAKLETNDVGEAIQTQFQRMGSHVVIKEIKKRVRRTLWQREYFEDGRHSLIWENVEQYFNYRREIDSKIIAQREREMGHNLGTRIGWKAVLNVGQGEEAEDIMKNMVEWYIENHSEALNGSVDDVINRLCPFYELPQDLREYLSELIAKYQQ